MNKIWNLYWSILNLNSPRILQLLHQRLLKIIFASSWEFWKTQPCIRIFRLDSRKWLIFLLYNAKIPEQEEGLVNIMASSNPTKSVPYRFSLLCEVLYSFSCVLVSLFFTVSFSFFFPYSSVHCSNTSFVLVLLFSADISYYHISHPTSSV